MATEKSLYKKRNDGRKMDEVRPMTAKVGIVPSADGSATFLFNNAAMTIPKAIAFVLVPLLLPATTVLSPLTLETCAGKVSFSR